MTTSRWYHARASGPRQSKSAFEVPIVAEVGSLNKMSG